MDAEALKLIGGPEFRFTQTLFEPVLALFKQKGRGYTWTHRILFLSVK